MFESAGRFLKIRQKYNIFSDDSYGRQQWGIFRNGHRIRRVIAQLVQREIISNESNMVTFSISYKKTISCCGTTCSSFQLLGFVQIISVKYIYGSYFYGKIRATRCSGRREG